MPYSSGNDWCPRASPITPAPEVTRDLNRRVGQRALGAPPVPLTRPGMAFGVGHAQPPVIMSVVTIGFQRPEASRQSFNQSLDQRVFEVGPTSSSGNARSAGTMTGHDRLALQSSRCMVTGALSHQAGMSRLGYHRPNANAAAWLHPRELPPHATAPNR